MRIMVSGVPTAVLQKVEDEIRAALAHYVGAGELNIVVTRLPAGAWVTYVFDAETGHEITVPHLAERLAGLMLR
jgi:hypothetical protein